MKSLNHKNMKALKYENMKARNHKNIRTRSRDFMFSCSRDRGFVLPLAVLLAGILLSIGLAIFSITLKELTLSSSGRESQIAFLPLTQAPSARSIGMSDIQIFRQAFLIHTRQVTAPQRNGLFPTLVQTKHSPCPPG